MYTLNDGLFESTDKLHRGGASSKFLAMLRNASAQFKSGIVWLCRGDLKSDVIGALCVSVADIS